MNILITSASRKVNLVRAFQEALNKEGGGKVIAVDIDPFSPALYIADDHYLVQKSNSLGFLSEILHLCEQYRIKLLIPTRDEELPFFAEHKSRFTEINTLVMVPDPEVVTMCQDKKLFINFCKQKGFAIPKSYDSDNLPINLGFPLFIKPRHGKGGLHTFRVDSQDDLDYVLKRVPDAIIQEFIHSPEYTIDLFSDFSSRVISVVPRERIQVFGGESFVGRTTNNPLLIQESIRLANNLSLIAHNTIQCFLDNDIVKFIEVNPRFGGGANLGFVAGAPTPHLLIKLLKGIPIEPMIGEFKSGFIMLRYTEDLFLDSCDLTKKHLL